MVPRGHLEGTLGVTLGVLWDNFEGTLEVTSGVLGDHCGSTFGTTLRVVWGHFEGTLQALRGGTLDSLREYPGGDFGSTLGSL